MSKNKIELYSFRVSDEKEVEKKEEIEENGEKITKTKKVKEKVSVTVVIKRPTRKLTDDADMYRAIKMSECIKKGIVTKQMLTKKYADTGGVLSELEAKNLIGKYDRISDLNMELMKLMVIKDRTKDQDEKIDKINKEINSIKYEIATIESNHSYLFENTADMISFKAEVLFYSLMLSAIKDDEGEEVVYKPFFKGDSFEEKLEDFYRKEDDPTDFYVQAVSKLMYLVGFWRNGVIVSESDFEKIEKDLDDGMI